MRRKKASRGILVGLSALAATALVAACSSSGGASDAGGTTSAGSSSSGSLEPVQQLAAEAAKEGSLTWYTVDPDTAIPKLVAAFNKQYPDVKVNVLRISADKIPSRVLTEQRGGKYNADVISGDSSYLVQLIKAGAVQPFTPEGGAPQLEGLDIPQGYEDSVLDVGTTVIAYNPQALKEKGLTPPTSFADLAKPEWKGQFSVNPGAVNWYEAMIAEMGHDKAKQLAQGMGNNSPRLVESHTQAATQVQSGEPVATAMAYGWMAAQLKAKTPQTLDFVNFNPIPAQADLMLMAKNAPHSAAAKLFVTWALSKSGQQARINIENYSSLRTDVKNNVTVWDPTKWKPVWAQPDIDPAQFNTLTGELRNAFNAE